MDVSRPHTPVTPEQADEIIRERLPGLESVRLTMLLNVTQQASKSKSPKDCDMACFVSAVSGTVVAFCKHALEKGSHDEKIIAGNLLINMLETNNQLHQKLLDDGLVDTSNPDFDSETAAMMQRGSAALN